MLKKRKTKTEESKVGNQRMNKVLSIEVTIIKSVYHLFWQENKMTWNYLLRETKTFNEVIRLAQERSSNVITLFYKNPTTSQNSAHGTGNFPI